MPSNAAIEHHIMDVSLSLFTDRIAKEYFNSVPSRYNAEKDAEKKAKMVAEASSIIGMLSVLVYKVYPTSAEFKKAISADSELSSNFTMIQGWLDTHGGKEKADRIYENVKDRSLVAALREAAESIPAGAN